METGQSFGLLQRGCNGRHNREEVLVAHTTFGWQVRSNSAKSACLTSRRSTASITSWQGPEISQSVGNLQLLIPRPGLAPLSRGLWRRVWPLLLDGLPCFVCCAGLIKQPDVTARLCRNLRYALAHGPRPPRRCWKNGIFIARLWLRPCVALMCKIPTSQEQNCETRNNILGAGLWAIAAGASALSLRAKQRLWSG